MGAHHIDLEGSMRKKRLDTSGKVFEDMSALPSKNKTNDAQGHAEN